MLSVTLDRDDKIIGKYIIMRVLFYKRVCYTHMCVNTERTLPSNRFVGREVHM